MQNAEQMLMEPSFAKDPPVKINVPAKTLGLVYAIFAAIGAVFGLFGLLALFGLGAVAVGIGAFAGLYWLGVLGAILGVAAAILVAWGGWEMYQGRHEGKRHVVHGIVLNVVGNLVSSTDLVGWLIGLAIAFCFYYLVIISRFPDEPPLVP